MSRPCFLPATPLHRCLCIITGECLRRQGHLFIFCEPLSTPRFGGGSGRATAPLLKKSIVKLGDRGFAALLATSALHRTLCQPTLSAPPTPDHAVAMSTAKRSKRRQPEAKSASPLPASKRLKTTQDAHVLPPRSGLGFLVDEDARHGKKLEARLANGVPGTKATRPDESRAVIAPDSRDEVDKVGGTQDTAIDISSAEESSSEDEEDELASRPKNGAMVPTAGQGTYANGYANTRGGNDAEEDAVAGAEDVEMAEGEDDQEPEEASFGDMLQARHPQPIDVQAAFPNPMADRQALIPASGSRVLSAPSGTSLGTVLTQALKTNDKDLLESCFQTTDLPSIRATIQRLQSQHVVTLLQRVAERIHRRPGRTGNLMVWIQWSLVAHGGYLATQPDLVRKLKSLSQVIRDRANGLQPLLHLKGKLDMLSAQLELRRNLQASSRAANADDDDNEEGVVYVEGRDQDWSDSEGVAGDDDVDVKMLESPRRTSTSRKELANVNGDVSDEESDSASEDDMPNGVAHEEEDDSSDAEDDEPGMFDIEAEVTDDDEGDEEEENSEEDGESEAESESELDDSDAESEASGVKQPKPTILNRKR